MNSIGNRVHDVVQIEPCRRVRYAASSVTLSGIGDRRLDAEVAREVRETLFEINQPEEAQ